MAIRVKLGSPFSFQSKTTTKRKFWLQMIILRERTEASFKKIILFSPVELSKWLLKAFGLQKGPYFPLFRRLVKIKTIFEVAMLCTLGDNNNDLITYIAQVSIKMIKCALKITNLFTISKTIKIYTLPP